MSSISSIRKDYKLRSLSESEVAQTPVQQFGAWWKEAIASEIDEVNAMTLATASSDGVPSARIVLLKDFDEMGFVFYTNYESFKAQQLAENPRACLVFFWKELERQVRVTGVIEKVSEEESTQYYMSRPLGSRIGAWASPQSREIPGREWLEQQEQDFTLKFQGGNVPKPPHWGGYRVKPIVMEFWQGRASRLHDRIQYTLEENGNWRISRLAP